MFHHPLHLHLPLEELWGCASKLFKYKEVFFGHLPWSFVVESSFISSVQVFVWLWASLGLLVEEQQQPAYDQYEFGHCVSRTGLIVAVPSST